MSRLALAFLALAALSCREAPPSRGPLRETAASMRAAQIPEAPLRGTLADRPFALQTAWLRVVRRARVQRVDLVLSEGRPSRLCGAPTPSDARQLVLRLRGVTALPAGELRVDGRDPLREVFAESPGEHAVEGLGSGNALLVIEQTAPDETSGRLRACFPDVHRSCVAGSFRARVCWDELDLDGPRGARDRAPDGGTP